MKTIYLLRHAKSSWADPEISDFDRPLNERGLDAAPFMGRLIAERGFEIESIVTSPAKRAIHTAELVRDAAGLKSDIVRDERIYEASPRSLRQVAAELDDGINSVMLVGHNPGMEGFIRLLTSQTESMPTAALAVIELDVNAWQEIAPSSGKVVKVFRPKEELRSLSSGGGR